MSEVDRIFAEAKARIRRAHEGIARQEKIVGRMKALGEDGMEHESTLAVLHQTLVLLEDNLRYLQRRTDAGISQPER